MLVTERRRITHLSAAAAFRLVDGLVQMEMTGPLSAATMARFAAEAVQAHGDKIAGWLLDYRKALLIAGPAELAGLPRRTPADSPVRRPGAFVCHPETVEPFRAHAFRLSLAGLQRKVFSDTNAAEAYVRGVSAVEPRLGTT